MTEKVYRARKGVNKSTLWELRRTPAHYAYRLEHQAEGDSAALRLGRAIHAAVLTPRIFKRQFRVAPPVDKRTKEGKAVWAEFVAGIPDGAEVISADEAETVEAISSAVRGHAEAAELLRGAEKEKALFWTDAESGLRCKAKLDAVRPGLVVDLKTVRDASSAAFERDAIRLGYHVQAAHYTAGVEALRGGKAAFVFICVEKEPPFAVHIFDAGADFLEYGEFERRSLLDLLHKCRVEKRWPGYQRSALGLPGWLGGGEE